ncbi:MAG TPA: TIGR02117 family protein [Allosphingosinicella sp.]
MKRPLLSTVRRIASWVAAGLVAIPFFYFLAAFILALVPANAGWREPEQGVTIFVRTNGVHTWIMVPKVTADTDWRPFLPGEHLKDPRWARASHVALGYGNRTFYLETPTWGDLTMKNAFLAAFGQGRSLMHADHAHAPVEDETQRAIVVSREQYARLTAFLRAGFQRDSKGRTIPLIGRGYSSNDMFYEAVGPYNALLTCNEWTGRALRHAGVRTGLWTPLSWSIMWRLD